MSDELVNPLLEHEAYNPDSDLGALSKEELDELEKVNSETILNLEAEVDLLERKIKMFGPGALPNKNFELIYRPDGTNNLEEIEMRLHKEIEDCSARVKETMRLTGVTIENITRQEVELVENHCKKQYSLELLVLNRKVLLTYTLEETLSLDGKSDLGGKVTWFEIKFEEDINEAVGAEIARAADGLAIHSVFSILKSYLQWQTTRDQTIKNFADMYPENVSQMMSKAGNKCLKVISTVPDRPELVIEWGRKTVSDRVEPDISVKVIAPRDLVVMDSRKILDSVPEMFALMVQSLGLEKAIHGLIQLVITDGEEPLEQPTENQVQEEQEQLDQL